MMDSYLLPQKQTRIVFFSVHFCPVHCLRENARDETVEALTFS